jgi:dTDP-4-dehydrorhamnose reductase
VRWLVTGADGMLGQDLVALLRAAAPVHDVTAASRETLDITDAPAAADLVSGHDVVVNCAAWTDVDGAEAHETDAARVNGEGPRVLARACRTAGSRLVQISTDYVFAGDGTAPYAEDTRPAPLSAYGRTKAVGEAAVREELPDQHLVVRTAWLYGAGGPCFPRTIARLARERGSLSVVDDQVGQPTWTADLADLVVRLVEASAPAGIDHGTASGQTSWCGFAREVVAALGLDPGVVGPTTTDAFPRPAPRPAYSVLGHDALEAVGVAPIADWRERWRVAAPEVLGPA